MEPSIKRILLASLVVLTTGLASLRSDEACAGGCIGIVKRCGAPSCGALTQEQLEQVCRNLTPPQCCYTGHRCDDNDPDCTPAQPFQLTCYYLNECP